LELADKKYSHVDFALVLTEFEHFGWVDMLMAVLEEYY